ncbi:stalk domain-containing protein [Paenibacillus sp. Aloe-11]|uniref:stalk domain-containing protein n=1 Tax=Paenibacillus sp. Aloe-11 TaxID=1050222 RepID=UPI00024EFC8E|nr:stalk domain-containing protein [Paenibacillus sp. Aloe-11]EHS57198.1 copper amine oxidase domain protein [Paenibacillus sp. Aloe-11]
MKFKKTMLLLMFSTILTGWLTVGTESVHAATSIVFREGDRLKLLLEDGNGANRVFKFNLENMIMPGTPIRLYSNLTEIPSSGFTVDYTNSTITIADSQPAPSVGSENHIVIPIGSIMEGSDGELKADQPVEEPKVTQPDVETRTKETPGVIESEVSQPVVDPQPIQPVMESKEDIPVDESPEIPLSIPSGENFPGTFTINSSGTSFAVRLKIKNIQPTYTAYVMVKNSDAQLVKRIQFDPATTFNYSLSNLNLSTGGYYFYIKMIDQSGNSAASVPQFVPINNNKAGQVVVFIDGKLQQYEQPATSISGSMLVPFRAVFEALGAKVKWDGATKTVTATKGNMTIKLTVGSRDAYINGKLVRLNAAPRLINGKVMVPIRFVSEALGAKVKWNIAAQSVVIFLAPPQVLTTSESEQLMEENEDNSEPQTNPTILKKISTTLTKSTDIVFVIDVTSSMTGTLDYVRQKVKGFVDSVPSGSQFAVVAFRDINLKADKDLEFFEFTKDKNKLKGNLNMLRPLAGGDLKESGLEAIQLAISKFPKNSSSKTIIFITDAPVHDKSTTPDKARFSVDEINEQLQKNDVVFNAIVPANGPANKQMKKLVDSNKGTLYDIRDAKLNLAK